MKTIIAAVFGTALLAGGIAWAQPAPPPGGPEAGGPEGGGYHRGPGSMDRMMQRRPPSKAAFFHFQKGDARVDIKCAEDEGTKACIEGASALFDKLAPQPK